MGERDICQRLIDKAIQLYRAPRALVSFSGVLAADRLLNDLEGTPHAFVLACVMDRQIKAELAWLIPFRFSEKLGDFEFSSLRELSLEQVETLMTEPEPLHRFLSVMSENFHLAVQRIADTYRGDASSIWADKPPSAAVVYRFMEFKGVGPKLASMAANILARDFKIPYSDYYSIDVSADVHVRRVFTRLGLVPPKPSNEQVIYRARAMHPDFPGMLDFPAWEIGRNWCRPRSTACDMCFMCDVCPSATSSIEE